jgi:hypothetical protein
MCLEPAGRTLVRAIELAARETVGAVFEVKRRVRGLWRRRQKSPRPIENHIQQGAFTRSAPRRAAPFMGENPVTDNRWGLAVVTLVAIAVFFSVWHFVAPLIG